MVLRRKFKRVDEMIKVMMETQRRSRITALSYCLLTALPSVRPWESRITYTILLEEASAALSLFRWLGSCSLPASENRLDPCLLRNPCHANDPCDLAPSFQVPCHWFDLVMQAVFRVQYDSPNMSLAKSND